MRALARWATRIMIIGTFVLLSYAASALSVPNSDGDSVGAAYCVSDAVGIGWYVSAADQSAGVFVGCDF